MTTKYDLSKHCKSQIITELVMGWIMFDVCTFEAKNRSFEFNGKTFESIRYSKKMIFKAVCWEIQQI